MNTFTLWLTIALFSCNQPGKSSQQQPDKSAGEISSTTVHEPAGASEAEGGIVLLAEMVSARATHTATRLNDGRILVCGGFAGNSTLSSAEIFDPATKKFRHISDMSAPRSGHSATLLPGGKVLIAGGFNGDYLSSAEIFDPKTLSFTRTNPMTIPRSGHTATLLENGKILFVGGVGTGWTFLQSAELYDIQSGKFMATGNLAVARESHTATLLQDGTVLITGGHKGRRAEIQIFSSAELYDPSKGTFMPTGSMEIVRHKHDAVRLADGNVLITGGADQLDSRGTYRSAEMYNTVSRKFIPLGAMNLAHYKHNGTSLLLSNGNVLIAGGANRAELFDAQKREFTIVQGSFSSQRLFSCATRLTNNDILITGGYDENIRPTANAFLFTYSND